MVHELFIVANTNLGSVSAAARQDQQLHEGDKSYVVVLGVATQDLDHVVLLKFNLFVHRVLQELLKGEWFLSVCVDVRLADSLRKRIVRPDTPVVVPDHVPLLNDEELVNQFFEGASASSNCLFKGCLGGSPLALLDGASWRGVITDVWRRRTHSSLEC